MICWAVQIKKLNDNLQLTMQKLEESRQLLKTNENGQSTCTLQPSSTAYRRMHSHISYIVLNSKVHQVGSSFNLLIICVSVINWLNRQVTENQLGRSAGHAPAGAFEMNSTGSTTRALVR